MRTWDRWGVGRAVGCSLLAAFFSIMFCGLVPNASFAQAAEIQGTRPPECQNPSNQDMIDACRLAIIMCTFTRGMPAGASGGDFNATVRTCVHKAVGRTKPEARNNALLRKKCLDNSDTDEIIRACTALLNAHEDTAKEVSQYYAFRGTGLLSKGRIDAAIEDLTNAIENDPGNGVAFLSRGQAHGLQGRYEMAAADLSSAADISERQGDYEMQAEALATRGNIEKYHLGKAHEGDADIARARSLYPNIDK